MDMHYYWRLDRARQKQFHIFWRRGKDATDFNLTDYPTNHHPTQHPALASKKWATNSLPYHYNSTTR